MSRKAPRVLILAGGFGTRLQKVVSQVPKPMAPIAGRPFLEYQIEYLKIQGFDEFTLLTGYLSELIEKHFGDGRKFGVSIDYSVEHEPLGTGGAIRQAMVASEGDLFLVLNGDGLFATDYRRFVRLAHKPASIALKYSEDLSRYGAVEIDGDYKIKTFREKSATATEGYINAGAYLIERSALDLMPTGKFSIESDVFSPLSEKKILGGIPCGGKFVDIGTPESFEWAQTHLPKWLDETFRPCLFLDRDGVLIQHKAYMHKPEEAVLVPEVVELIRQAKKNNWYTVVITNQAGVARGYFSEEDCEKVHRRIDEMLAEKNIRLDAWFSCPTHPEGVVAKYKRDSFCRKPQPGMLLKACEVFPINLSRSLMFGDNGSDQINLPDLKVVLVQGDFELKKLKPATTVTPDFASLREVCLPYLEIE